jgi:hypothetical protein
MKKFTLFLVLSAFIGMCFASADLSVRSTNDQVNVVFSNTLQTEGERSSVETYILPATEAEIRINRMVIEERDVNGNLLNTLRSTDENRVRISDNYIMREMYAFDVEVLEQTVNNGITSTITELDYDLVAMNSVPLPTEISSAFRNAYENIALNFNDSYLRDLPDSKPRILMIGNASVLGYISSFIAWKRALGFDVDFASTADCGGNTLVAIDAYIENYYNTYRQDYVILFGDTTGEFAIPTNYYQSPDGAENDADDNYYSMIEGDDSLPDTIIGRISFNNIQQLLTIVNKTKNYERNPFIGDYSWFNKALMVAGNYAEGGLQPSTPTLTCDFYAEIFEGDGFDVNKVYYPPHEIAATTIRQYINAGLGYIIYRGWGDATGWHYPRFHKDDLESTTNGPKSPVVLSIVCNTGDFANATHVECFGEYWMHLGTPSSPNGCVAFVGPSDLHTRTSLNNSFSSGIVDAICNKGERSFGAAVLCGKIEIFNNFPMERGTNGYVPFYNHIYAILSDPSLRMWYGAPLNFTDNLPEEIDRATSSLEVIVPGMDGAVITGTKDNLNYTYTKVINGRAILPIDTVTDGDLIVTITKPNYLPIQKTIIVSESTDNIAVTANVVTGGEYLLVGETMEVTYTLKNLSANSYDNVTATLTTSNPEIASITATQNVGTLASNAEANAVFSIELNGSVLPNTVVEVSLAIAPTNTIEKFSYRIGGGALYASTTTSMLNIGASTSVSIDLTNIGRAAFADGDVEIRSLCDAATITSNSFTGVGAIAVGGTATVNFDVDVASNCFPGRSIPFALITTDDSGYECTSHISIVAGSVDNTAPTGPDAYGYYAYDNNDTDWEQAPTYEWIEIDPRDGGQGTVTEVTDDQSVDFDLPFTFRYYGEDYNSITACSNGWISFIQTWMSNFDNCYIPAVLGPYAMVAPYWEDLKGLQDGTGGFLNMRLVTWHDSANNRFIIEWNDAYNRATLTSDNPSLEKFQLILYPNQDQDGDLVVMYHTVDNPTTNTLGNHSTVGIENHTQTVGLTYSFSNEYPASASPLQAGLAVRYTTTAPDPFVHNEQDTNPGIQSSILSQNYPNPFNPETTISFNLNTNGYARLDVYNQRGQYVTTLANGNYESGLHSFVWNGTDREGKPVSSGIYLYKLQAGTYTKTRKMILIK